jgi:hypothetical protein
MLAEIVLALLQQRHDAPSRTAVGTAAEAPLDGLPGAHASQRVHPTDVGLDQQRGAAHIVVRDFSRPARTSLDAGRARPQQVAVKPAGGFPATLAGELGVAIALGGAG